MKSTKTIILAVLTVVMSLPAFAQDTQTAGQPALTPAQMQFAFSAKGTSPLVAALSQSEMQQTKGGPKICWNGSDGTCLCVTY